MQYVFTEPLDLLSDIYSVAKNTIILTKHKLSHIYN